MARKKARSKRKARPKAPRPRWLWAGRLLAHLLRALGFVGRLVARAMVRVGPGLGALALLWLCAYLILTHVRDRQRFAIDATELKILDCPAWLPYADKHLVLAGLPEKLSFFDGDLTTKITTACEANPWIKKVHYVRKEYPCRILIKADVRRPFAAAAVRDRYYIVDADGVRLPVEYEEWPVPNLSLPVIQGVDGPVGEEGRVWDHAGVRAGVAVLAQFKPTPYYDRLGISAVNVANVNGRVDSRDSEVVLVGARGVNVLWGRAGSDKALHELTLEEKLRNLEKYLEQNPNPYDENIEVRFLPTEELNRRWTKAQ